MGYKVNPLSLEELRELAVQRLGVPVARESNVLSAAQTTAVLEELAISQLEVEIQNEHLQETCTRLDEALTEATDLYDFAPVGCISTDPEVKITKVNVAACRLLGQERQHLIGHDFAGFFLPGQRGRIHALIQQVNAAAEDLGCELTLDGDPSQATRVQWFVSPIAGALGYHMVLNDITVHKAVEEDLRTQVERWKFTLDATCDGVWDWDVQSGSVSYSPKLAQLFGCPQVHFGVGMEAWRLRVHPEDWPVLLAALQKCLPGPNTHLRMEHRERCKDGSWKWILCQGAVFARDASGRVVRMLGTHTDISQRKQTEDELLQVAALQQALFEATPQYLAVLDSSCRVMKTNAIWDAYGLAKGHAYHNGWARSDYAALLDAVTGGDLQIRQAALAGIADVISGRAPRFQMEYAFQAGAQLRSFTMSVMAVRDGQARAVVIHQDVSRFSQPHAALRGLDQAQGLLVKCFG